MPLSDRGLRAALDAGRFRVDPLNPDDVQPCSIDLHLHHEVITPTEHGGYNPVTCNGTGNHATIPDSGHVLLPGDFVLASTLETVTLGPDVMARVDGKSTLGRWGIGIHVTAGLIDPGFTGQITLEIVNHAPAPRILTAGMPIGQLVVERLSSDAVTPYGAGTGAHYQGQRGPQLPRAIGEGRLR